MLGDLLRAQAAREPDAVAFVDGERRLTYAEWDWLSDRAAFTLWSEGVRAGDVVAMLLDSPLPYPIAYLGAAKIGCATAGINPRLAQPEVEHILEDSRARAVITDRPLHPEPMLFTPERLLHPGGAPPRVEVGHDTPLALVYTTGTTGAPKGAAYTAGALEAVRRIERAFEPLDHPRVLQAIPMPHMQFMTKIAAFIDRMTTAVLTPQWSARAALESIERERLTAFGGVPAQLALMLREPAIDSLDLSSLKQVTLGGAPASPDLIRSVRAAFNAPVVVRYSCTELGLCTATHPGDPDEVVATTVGRPLPEVELRILRPGEDGVGEVAARSPAMMRGYWPIAGAGLDEHGYFHTGDLGRLRPDGTLQLVGRAKEMFIRGGYNVYPVEIENVLRAHPKVSLVAVLGVPDPVLGEKGKAFVVPADTDDPPTEDELRAFVGRALADFKVPDFWEFRKHLPLNATFKVDKRALAREL